MNKAKSKGYRTVRKGRDILEKRGYIFANLEKTGKFVIEKDLFNLWDALAIKGKNRYIFIQFKTNKELGIRKLRKWTLPFIKFAKKHGNKYVSYQIWVKYDYKGFIVLDCNTEVIYKGTDSFPL